MEIEKVWEEFDALPSEAQKQVVDFIEFLRQRSPKPPAKKPAKTTELSQESFIGMWRDRTDMQDSTAWVRSLRQREWTG